MQENSIRKILRTHKQNWAKLELYEKGLDTKSNLQENELNSLRLRLEFLDSCIDDLREDEKYTIEVIFFKKLQVSQLAVLMNISYSGAKKRVERAVAAIEKRYFG